jgi:hypothetical protein
MFIHKNMHSLKDVGFVAKMDVLVKKKHHYNLQSIAITYHFINRRIRFLFFLKTIMVPRIYTIVDLSYPKRSVLPLFSN